MTSIRRALAISMAERYVHIGIALLGNILIARLLTPEEIGIYSVSLAIIGIAQVLRDFGIGSFLIQQKDLSEAHIRTAFGISLVVGSLLFLVVFFSAPWVGKFYGEERMVETMRISSLNFLVLPFCSISVSLLRRNMLFNRLAAVTLTSHGIGFATTISLAFLGFGPNSMAIGAVASAMATGLGAWLARSDRQLLLPGFAEWRSLLKFGGQSSLANLTGTLSTDANDLIVGKLLGFASVAIISRAQGLMNLFHRDLMATIRGVAHPAFAQAYRRNSDMESRYCHSVGILTAFAWPFYGFVALFPYEIVRLLFGMQWDDAARLVPYFCLAGMFGAFNSLIPTLLLARGEVNLLLRLNLIVDPLRLITFAAVLVVAPSVDNFAIVFLGFFILSIPIAYYVKDRVQPTDYRALWSKLRKSAVVSLVPSSVVYFVSVGMKGEASRLSLLELMAMATLMVVVWVMAVIMTGHSLVDEPGFRHVVSSVRSIGVRLGRRNER